MIGSGSRLVPSQSKLCFLDTMLSMTLCPAQKSHRWSHGSMSKDNKKINKTKYLSGVIFFKMHNEL